MNLTESAITPDQLPVRFEDESKRYIVNTKLYGMPLLKPRHRSCYVLCTAAEDVIQRGGKSSVYGLAKGDDGVYLSTHGVHDYQRISQGIEETRAGKDRLPLRYE